MLLKGLFKIAMLLFIVVPSFGFTVALEVTNNLGIQRMFFFRAGDALQVGKDRQDFVCYRDTFFSLAPHETRTVLVPARCTIPMKASPEIGTPVVPAPVKLKGYARISDKFQPRIDANHGVVNTTTPNSAAKALDDIIHQARETARTTAPNRSLMY